MDEVPYSGPRNEMPFEHLRRFLGAYDDGLFNNIPSYKGEFNSVVIAGMGGSGIIGYTVSDFYKNVSEVPVEFLRANRPPAYISEGVLAFIISYSGNTREMLNFYTECQKRNCHVIVITAGGKLERMAKNDGVPMIKLDGGFTPRSDILFAIGHSVAIIDAYCGTHMMDLFVSAVRSAIPYAAILADTSDPHNQAMALAKKLSDKIPFIYGSESFGSLVNRWKCQINENAKIPAACGTFPEFNHNSLEGWYGNPYKSIIPLFLGETDQFIDIAADIMASKNNSFIMVPIPGESHQETIINGMVLGDYVSLYLADILSVDASPVYAIKQFKDRTADLE